MRNTIAFTVLLALTLTGIAACSGGDDPAGPDIGQNLLEATINGVELAYGPTEINGAYDPATDNVFISGNKVVTTGGNRNDVVLQLRFEHDLLEGALPATITSPNLSILHRETRISDSTTWVCSLGDRPGDCQVTITSYENDILLKGIFSGTLINLNDTNERVPIANGQFAVQMDAD